MANGGDLTPDDIHNLGASLREAEPTFRSFASSHGMKVSSHSGTFGKEWPMLELNWETEVAQLTILLRPESRDSDRLTMSIIATTNRGKSRYWRKEALVTRKPLATFKAELPNLLEEGRQMLRSWTLEDLEYLDDLGGRPRPNANQSELTNAQILGQQHQQHPEEFP